MHGWEAQRWISVEQLQLIRNAHGDPALLALATVDLTFPDIPDD